MHSATALSSDALAFFKGASVETDSKRLDCLYLAVPTDTNWVKFIPESII